MTRTVVAVIIGVKPPWPAAKAEKNNSSDDLKTLLEVLDMASVALLR
jgi:hypothetical protein